MSMREEEFLQKLRATFKVEADEHVQAMSSGLLELEKTPGPNRNPEQLEKVFRHAHSLKGAARAVNFVEIESVCQSLEDVFAAWKRGKIDLSSADFDTLHRAIDLMGKFVLTEGKPSHDASAMVSVVTQQLIHLAFGEAPSYSPTERPDAEVQVGPVKLAQPDKPAIATATLPQATSAIKETLPDPSRRPALTETIRVSTAKLDRLLLNAEEMLIVKQSAIQRADDLRQLETTFEQWTKQWAKVQPPLRKLRNASISPSPLGTASSQENLAPTSLLSWELVEFLDWNLAYIKSLEGKLRALGKLAAQDQYTVGKRIDDLLADSKQLVMLPFSTLADLFPKFVRDLSRDQGKEVTLVVRGGDVEMDKRILEEMKDPLIHLVRNSIDHGLGKTESNLPETPRRTATITITAAPVNGNKVEILVSDNGAGIDVARVKEAAVKRRILSAADAQSLDESKAMELIFQSDVSTSPIITEISGRGLGLAIVREKTEKLGGRVSVESQARIGTTFRIGLPVTLATFRGILIEVTDKIFVIPSAQVARVARTRPAEIKTVENRETIALDGRVLSFTRLQDVLDLTGSDQTVPATDFISVVVLGSGQDQIAFGVDAVLHVEEVLVKNLVRPLSRVRNIAAATVLASGKIALILNAADVVKSARKMSVTSRVSQVVAGTEQKKTKTILLAEDSITSRMLLKGILESAGYRVKTAVDGMEAFTTLRTEEFDLVVSDVEMPRLNGFDLTARIRNDKRLAEKPVILVTALSAQKDRERGIDVGANAYIVKSSFDQSNLLDVIRRLI